MPTRAQRLNRRYRHNDLTGEYRWNEQAQLVGFRDHELRLEYDFAYDADGTLAKIVIRPLGKSVLAADAAPADEHNGSEGWLHWFGAENRRGKGVPALCWVSAILQHD